MTSSLRFRINSPDVVQDTIDGEVVIVNLRSGNYYSMDKTGVEIWSLLERGNAQGDIVEFVSQQYEGTRGDIEKSISNLFDELQKEAIIVPAEPLASQQQRTNIDTTHSSVKHEKPPFMPPLLQKYTDMQDLLLLDPIHEVDEKGWPNAAREKN